MMQLTPIAGKTLASCILFVLSLLCIGLPAPAFSQQPADGPFNRFTMHLENDIFGGTDRGYTNGLKLTWGTAFSAVDNEAADLPGWIYAVADRLPRVNELGSHRALFVSLGQNIYTPEDIQRSDLIEDDRPYAGFTYIGLGFLGRKDARLDVWELQAGVVGPLSMAEQTQNFVHQIVGSPKAQGWEHQLKNEPALEVIRETKWRLWSRDFHRGFSVDLIPHLGARLGNIAIYANTGAELRLGWDLPRDFGTCPIRPGCNVGDPLLDMTLSRAQSPAANLQTFLAVDGRAVLHDIFLDGNTFVDSHSVDKEPFVADLITGIGFQYGRARFTYSYVYRTPEFKERREAQLFGAVTLSWSY
jgi:hypothetical protein